MIIGRATEAHRDEFFLEVSEAVRSSPAGYPKAERVSVDGTFSDLLKKGVVLVAELDGIVLGTLALSRTTFMWSAVPFFADVFFFVWSDYRKTGAADALVSKAKEIARFHGDSLMLGMIHGEHVEAKSRWYRMNGLLRVGGNFWLGAN